MYYHIHRGRFQKDASVFYQNYGNKSTQSIYQKDPTQAKDFKQFYNLVLQDPKLKQTSMTSWLGIRLCFSFIFKYGTKLVLFSVKHMFHLLLKYKKQVLLFGSILFLV